MPVILCPVCAKGSTLPASWKFAASTCPHCAHTFKVPRSAALYLRHFVAPVTVATATEMERIVPIINTALGIRVSREQFLALAVAALGEKYGPGAPQVGDTAEVASLKSPRVRADEDETGAAETTGRAVQPGAGTQPAPALSNDQRVPRGAGVSCRDAN
jgi:hypothetical protein